MLSEKEQTMNNYEQMREIVGGAITKIENVVNDELSQDAQFCVGCLLSVKQALESALALPPRQCDMGTAKEQSERFRNFCKIESSASGGHCTGCRAICYGRDKCEFIWAQMSYDIGGAK